MDTGRLEAFSDGVIAVIITIMVLELKVPHGFSLAALRPELPVFVAYVLSFIYVGIYWNNHHHLFAACDRIDGRSMWANLHLLFWLSLVPFSTAWAGENPSARVPTAVYGAVLLMAAIAYFLLQSSIVAFNGRDALLARALGSDWKGKVSPVLYLLGIAAALVSPPLADAIYAVVAALWFVPDRRIERVKIDASPGDANATERES